MQICQVLGAFGIDSVVDPHVARHEAARPLEAFLDSSKRETWCGLIKIEWRAARLAIELSPNEEMNFFPENLQPEESRRAFLTNLNKFEEEGRNGRPSI
jgi:hypothetical protein